MDPNEISKEQLKDIMHVMGLMAANIENWKYVSVNAEYMDKKRVADALLRKRHLRVVLHLETPRSRSRLRPKAIESDKVLQKLKTLIKAIDPHPCVVDQDTIKPGMSWAVQG